MCHRLASLAEAPQYLFANDQEQEMVITVLMHQENVRGKLSFPTVSGWQIEPAEINFMGQAKSSELRFFLKIIPPSVAGKITLKPRVQFAGKPDDNAALTLERIDYDHIPIRIYQPPLSVELIKLDVNALSRRIAYVPGSGDEVPQALRRMGYQPEIVEASAITPEMLKNFDVVVTGIRAYNVHPEMAAKHDYLMKFVEAGGTVVVQYNTAHRLTVQSPGPYPLKLSRFRVTDETAEMRLLNPGHSVLSYPNQISADDFEGWVQERGLYFAGEWDPNYQALFGSNDEGEPSRDGGLLVAEYGKGVFYLYRHFLVSPITCGSTRCLPSFL